MAAFMAAGEAETATAFGFCTGGSVPTQPERRRMAPDAPRISDFFIMFFPLGMKLKGVFREL